MRSTPRITGAATALFLALVLGCSFLLAQAPQKPALCIWRNVTGLPCPSCGMTRAFISLGHGEIRKALSLNPASPVLYASAWIAFVLGLFQSILGRDLLSGVWSRVRKPCVPGAVILMIGAWIWNLTVYFR